MEHCAMSKPALKKSKRRTKAVVPALGITGLFLSLASGATASTGETTTNLPATSQPHELFLGEEEIFDTSLSTFYVFDKETAGANSLAQDLKLAFGCGGCCGCPGCALTWPTEKSEGGSVAGVHRRHERREHRRGHHTGSSSSGSSSSSSPK
jgi:hypothetical protein